MRRTAGSGGDVRAVVYMDHAHGDRHNPVIQAWVSRLRRSPFANKSFAIIQYAKSLPPLSMTVDCDKRMK